MAINLCEMLTPAFQLRQDENFLTIEIRAPYTKITQAEIYFDEDDFRFCSAPYFLRLVLPGRVVENGKETAKYEADTGTFTIEMPKERPGEAFAGLDLLTKLLAPRTSTGGAPGIEVMAEGVVNCDAEQKPWTEDDEAGLVLGARSYGFAGLGTGIVARLRDTIPDLVDIEDPEHTSVQMAREEREKQEREHFSEEHYLADLYEPSALEDVLRAPRRTPSGPVVFTEDEKEKMRNLPRREYLLNSRVRRTLLLGLADILYAYAYDVRITEGEHCVESGWTISKLSATLSWLEEFESAERVVLSCLRRSLCYPLYRSWALALRVLEDATHVLQQGPRHVLRCLLDVHGIFARHDSCYVLNRLYVDHYAAWVQHLRPEVLSELADDLREVRVTKAALDLDLEELEAGAAAAVAEAEAGALSDAVAALGIGSTAPERRRRPSGASSSLDSDDDDGERGASSDSGTD